MLQIAGRNAARTGCLMLAVARRAISRREVALYRRSGCAVSIRSQNGRTVRDGRAFMNDRASASAWASVRWSIGARLLRVLWPCPVSPKWYEVVIRRPAPYPGASVDAPPVLLDPSRLLPPATMTMTRAFKNGCTGSFSPSHHLGTYSFVMLPGAAERRRAAAVHAARHPIARLLGGLSTLLLLAAVVMLASELSELFELWAVSEQVGLGEQGEHAVGV